MVRIPPLAGSVGAVAALAFLMGPASGDGSAPLPLGALVRLGTARPPNGPAVTCVAFAPDGKTLAAGSQDKTVRLWDVGTGKEVRRLVGHGDWVSTVAFSPDGKLLVSGGRDWTVRLWDPATGQELRQLDGPRAGVLSVAFAPDGRTLAAGSQDKTIYLWDVATGRSLHQLTDHLDWVTALAFSPDGATLVSGSWDGTVRLWEAATGKERRRLGDRHGRVLAVAFAPNSTYLAVVSQSQPIRQWDVASGQQERTFGEPRHRAVCLAFAPDGKALAAASRDGIIRRWDTATGRELYPLGQGQHRLLCLAFSPNGRTLASGGWDTSVLIWDAAGLGRKPAAPAGGLTPPELDRLWADLAAEDTTKAYRAAWILVQAPEQTVSLLKAHLRPVTVDTQRVTRLIGELDDEQFAVRDRATRELERVGKLAQTSLQEALKIKRPLDFRKRLERLLERVEGEDLVPDPDRLRSRRALQILERLTCSEARQLLQTLAGGAPEAWLTQEARTALARRAERTSSPP